MVRGGLEALGSPPFLSLFNYLCCRLPSDILIKVLSYLDAGALFTVGHVSRLLHQFASDK